MITVQIRVDDAMADQLQEQDPGKPLQAVIERKLAATRALQTTGKMIMVGQAELEALEGILGGGSILNGQDLVQKANRLAGISFEHIRLQFSPSQLELVQRKAEGSGRTVDQLIEQMAPRIMEQFFGLVPA